MVFCFFRQHIALAVFALLIIECISLKLMELRVPPNLVVGTRAELSCRWQLDPTDVLYSVKWYKDGKEFFRHVPKDVETRRKFPLPGVDVEKSDSSASEIKLSPATLETGGRYRCEVSGERPLFQTVSDHADMLVVVQPDHGPVLSGFRPRYRVGDRVHVNCTSGQSHPSTSLTWYINGEPVSNDSLLPAIYHTHGDGLKTTSLVLDFNVTEKHFKKNGLKVKCLATLVPIYWRSNEESAIQDKNKIYEDFEQKRVDDYRYRADADGVHVNFAINLKSDYFMLLLFSVLTRILR